MVSITISVPEEIRELMKKFPEVNWSGMVRKSIIETTKQLQMKEEILRTLKKEEDFNNWAVEVVRKGRKNDDRSRHKHTI